MTGIAIYLALVVAAAAAVAFGVRVPGPDAQRRVRGLLALGSVYLAVATSFGGWTSFMRPWWHALVLLLAAMILGNCLGLLVGFQKASNRAGRWAGRQLGPSVPASRFGFAVAVVLGLNPLGWLAGLLAGLTGDWRPLVFKGFLDALGVWSTAAGRPASAALGAALVAASQAGLMWVGELTRIRSEGTDVAAMFGMMSGVYLAVLPLVLLSIARVPLSNLFLSLPSVIVLTRLWQG